MDLTSLSTNDSTALRTNGHQTEGIQLKCLQNHLATLIANSFIGHNVPNADIKLSQISKAFNFLDQVHPFISLILQTVAASKDFRIVFDFNKSLALYLDVAEEQAKRSSLMSTREIYVPAANLIDPNLINEVYGLLAHELCLLALDLVYNNYCLPYYNKHEKDEKIFNKISDFCKVNRHKEDLINLVYSYPQEMQHSELVAQYAYMLVKYAKIPFKMEQIKVNFTDLSKFCEGLVAYDIKNRIPEILNNESCHRQDQNRKTTQIWVALTIFVLLMPFIIWLAISLTKPYIDPIYSCKNLTDELRPKIFDSTVDFQGVNVIFGDLFGRNSSACEHLSPQEVTRMLKVFDAGKFVDNYTGIYVNFTDEEVEKFVDKSEVNHKFENLNKVIYDKNNQDKDENIYKKYKKIKFREPSLKIHKKVNLSSKFYIERYITYPNPFNSTQTQNLLTFNYISTIKLLFLSDKSGSGKSTFFRHMAWKLKRQFPLKWISYIDLKQHISVLKDVPKTDANLTTFVDFLSSKILNLTSKVEIDVFKRKFLSNDSIFLWDGVDEVGFGNTEGILGLDVKIEGKLSAEEEDLAREKRVDGFLGFIKIISKLTDNKQWLGSRTHLEDAITYKLGIEANNFVKFDEKDKKEFIEKFIVAENVKNLDPSMIMNEWMKFSNKFRESTEKIESLDEVWLNFDTSPQILQIVCELYSKNITFGNGLNINTIFEDYFNRIVSNSSENLDLITKTLQHYAVGTLVKYPIYNVIKGEHDLACRDLKIHNSTIYTNFNLILHLGVVHKNGENILFEDRIFQDFFIAQYFFDNIYNLKDEVLDEYEAGNRLEFLFYTFFAINFSYRIIADHVIGFIESYQNQVSPEFNSVFRDLICENFSRLLVCLTFVDAAERIEFATKFFKKDSKIINCLWKMNENRTFFQKYLEISTKADKVKAMKKVIDVNFSPEDAETILVGKNQSANFLSILWHNRWNIDDATAVMDATGFYYDIKILQNIPTLEDFMEFLKQKNFYYEEIREFFFANVYILLDENIKLIKRNQMFNNYAKTWLLPDDYVELIRIKNVKSFVNEEA